MNDNNFSKIANEEQRLKEILKIVGSKIKGLPGSGGMVGGMLGGLAGAGKGSYDAYQAIEKDPEMELKDKLKLYLSNAGKNALIGGSAGGVLGMGTGYLAKQKLLAKAKENINRQLTGQKKYINDPEFVQYLKDKKLYSDEDLAHTHLDDEFKEKLKKYYNPETHEFNAGPAKLLSDAKDALKNLFKKNNSASPDVQYKEAYEHGFFKRANELLSADEVHDIVKSHKGDLLKTLKKRMKGFKTSGGLLGGIGGLGLGGLSGIYSGYKENKNLDEKDNKRLRGDKINTYLKHMGLHAGVGALSGAGVGVLGGAIAKNKLSNKIYEPFNKSVNDDMEEIIQGGKSNLLNSLNRHDDTADLLLYNAFEEAYPHGPSFFEKNKGGPMSINVGPKNLYNGIVNAIKRRRIEKSLDSSN
jgi:hypothetical protein